MASLSTFLTLTLFSLSHVNAKEVVIPEEGYTVTTVFDGHKPHIFPYTLLQRPFSSDLILLDSVNSTFYSAQFPISQEIVFTRLSGDGSVGYSDGDVGSAQFAKPKSFAFDLRGNVYVADKFNHAIRKISAKGLGAVMTWTLGLGLSCLLGIVIGIALRPYIIPNKGTSPCHFTETWKQCLTSPAKVAPTPCYGAIASCSCSYVLTFLAQLCRLCLSHLVCLYRIRINTVSPRPHPESVSLLDLDAHNSGEVTKPGKYYDQLKDLISFDEDSTKETLRNRSIGRSVCHEGDIMIKAKSNTGFVEPSKDNILYQESSVCNMGIVKRR